MTPSVPLASDSGPLRSVLPLSIVTTIRTAPNAHLTGQHLGRKGLTIPYVSKPPTPTLRGRVKFFLTDEGWGGIESDEVPGDVYVSYSVIHSDGSRGAGRRGRKLSSASKKQSTAVGVIRPLGYDGSVSSPDTGHSHPGGGVRQIAGSATQRPRPPGDDTGQNRPYHGDMFERFTPQGHSQVLVLAQEETHVSEATASSVPSICSWV